MNKDYLRGLQDCKKMVAVARTHISNLFIQNDLVGAHKMVNYIDGMITAKVMITKEEIKHDV
jgi:hypothetical protein